MTVAPEDAIRQYLDQEGGTAEVPAHNLLTSWQVDQFGPMERSKIGSALDKAGIEIEPGLDSLDRDTVVTLRVREVPRLPETVPPWTRPAENEPVSAEKPDPPPTRPEAIGDRPPPPTSSGGPPPPAPSAPPAEAIQSAGNGLAVAALVCGIVGLVLGFIPILFFVAWALGITAFVLGLIARRNAKRNPRIGRKTMATWGICLGLASFAMGIVGFAILDDIFSDTEDELSEISEDVGSGRSSGSNESSDPSEPDSEPTDDGLNKTVGLGETLRFPGQWSVAVESVNRSPVLAPQEEFSEEVAARGEFVILEMRVANLTKGVETFDSSLVNLVDADGTVYSAETGGGGEQIGNLAGYLDEKELQPKVTESGRVAFDIPKGAAVEKAQVAENLDIFDFEEGPFSFVELPAS